MARARIEVNLEELDQVLEEARQAPLSEDDYQKLKFETSLYRAVSRGLPSSLVQHDVLLVFLTQVTHSAFRRIEFLDTTSR